MFAALFLTASPALAYSGSPPDGRAATLSAVTARPSPVLATTAAAARFTITVRRTWTLSFIGARVHIPWQVLWWDNRSAVPDPNVLAVGTVIHFGRWDYVRPWLERDAMAAIPAPAPAPAPASSAGPSAASSSPDPPAAAPAASYSGAPGSFQACVIARESGGDPAAVNPYSGAGGLYGFLPSTWAALGYSGLPEDASVATQNAAFEAEYAAAGTSPWAPYDGC